MRRLLLISAILLAFSVHAQEAKVIKTSGKRALIEFSGGTPVKPGETIHIGGGGSGDDISLDSSSSSGGSGWGKYPAGSRENSIGGSASFVTSQASSSAGNKTTSIGYTTITLTGSYGWNKRQYEFGPEFSILNASGSASSTSSSTSYMIGGFFDYNLKPNDPGVKLIYGFGGSFDIGSASSGGNSTTNMVLFAGGNVKYWPLGNTVAVRGDAGLRYERDAGNGVTLTDTGFAARGGFEVYY